MDVNETILSDDFSDETLDLPMRPTTVTRDEVYYFQNVTFQVGNTLFRVPRNVFNVPGTIFQAMFALPPTPDAEGSSDENPIMLDVDENHFKGFLRILFRLGDQKAPTDEDWLGALVLATMWTFCNIRQEAIHALHGWAKSQSLKQVILIAKENSIVSWLQTAYTQLVIQSRHDLPFDELTTAPAVDWETIAKLYHARQVQKTLSNNRGCFQCTTGKFCCGYIAASVEDIFKLEFESIKGAYIEDPPLPIPEDSTGNFFASLSHVPKKKKKKANLSQESKEHGITSVVTF